MLQDEVVYTITRGIDLTSVLALDLVAFRSLYESLRRLEAQEKMQGAWLSMVAAQGTDKVMTDFLKKLGYDRTARFTAGSLQDGSAAIKKLGKGF